MQQELMRAMSEKPKYGAFPIALLIPFLIDFLTGFLSKCGEDQPVQAAWEHLDRNSYTARAAVRLGLDEFYAVNDDYDRPRYGLQVSFRSEVMSTMRAMGAEALKAEVESSVEAEHNVTTQLDQLI